MYNLQPEAILVCSWTELTAALVLANKVVTYQAKMQQIAAD
jgi:hypothetical protein